MSTYASPKIIKYSLLISNSIIFILGFVILINGIISKINFDWNDRKNHQQEKNITTSKNQIIHHQSESALSNIDEDVQDRFPSAASSLVKMIFGVMTIIMSMWGITAVTKSDRSLLITYSFMLIIGFILRFLFLIATVQMHKFNKSYDPITTITLLSVSIMIVELILVMCACHLAKIIKRGDAAVPHIPKLPSSEE